MGWFSDIPLHNQMDVVRKFNDFKQFVRFKKCSRESKEIGDMLRHRLPLKCYQATIKEDKMKLELYYIYQHKGHNLECAFDEPIRLIVRRVSVRSTTTNGMEIAEIIERSGLNAKELDVNKNKGNLDLATIDRLFRLLKAKKLRMENYSSHELLQLEELKNMRGIYFDGGVMQDSELLQLQAQKITICYYQINGKNERFSSLCISTFFKQWLEGKRKIEELDIPVDDTYAMVADLDHIELWDRFDDSLPYSHIKMEENEYGEESLLSVYLLKREEDNKRLIIGVGYFEGCKLTANELEEDEDIEDWIRENYHY